MTEKKKYRKLFIMMWTNWSIIEQKKSDVVWNEFEEKN